MLETAIQGEFDAPAERPAARLSAADERLLTGLVAGDERSQRIFFDRFQGLVRAHLHRVLRNPSDVDDALQVVFTRAFAGIEGFKGQSSLSTWLYRITANTARNVIRSRARQERLSRAFRWVNLGRRDRLVESPVDERDDVSRLLDALRPKLREVFVLYHHEGLNLREIAEVIDRPLSTVGDRLGRARKQLRALVFDRGGI
ncbi:MAG: RNA polymerase sigma factor [Nannocystaceae bacterium]|nr:RNA polymerase sigma factor [Myxococcales bacterium]